MDNKTIINKLEKLSMLRLNDEEKKSVSLELDELLEYFSALSKSDLKNEEPLTHLFGLKNVLREDIASTSLSQGEITKNSPFTDKGFFTSPEAVETEDRE